MSDQSKYEHLYNQIKKALGEDRYNHARELCLENDSYGLNTILVVAINTLREDAGDFDELGLNLN